MQHLHPFSVMTPAIEAPAGNGANVVIVWTEVGTSKLPQDSRGA
jgi:hypothetical protein